MTSGLFSGVGLVGDWFRVGWFPQNVPMGMNLFMFPGTSGPRSEASDDAAGSAIFALVFVENAMDAGCQNKTSDGEVLTSK